MNLNVKDMTVRPSDYPKERIRLGVWFFYLMQGLCFSTWASRIPDIKAVFAADDVLFWSWMLFLIPAGKFVALPLAGWLVSRLGSRTLVQAGIAGYAATLFSIGVATDVYVLGGSLFGFGVCWNLCDISLNTQGIGIERLTGRPVMAAFHGGWSLAACAGALLGFLMIVRGVAPPVHFSLVAAVIVLGALFARRYLQEDVEPVQVQAQPQEGDKKEPPALLSFVRKPEWLLLELGVVSLFALIVESAMFDWSGVYFKSVIRAPDSLQIGFLVFMVMVTAGRFLTGYAQGKLGKRGVLQLAGILIFAGFFLSAVPGGLMTSMTGKVTVISLGFMLVGLGISSMVPTVYSLVGAKSGTPVGIALTILSSIAFIGSLIAPPLIGLVSRTFSLQYAYMLVGLLGLCILLMTTFRKAFKN
jgi:MFS family permease